jgi:hypothetical protein
MSEATHAGPVSLAQKLAQLDVGQPTTRRSVGLVNDESMTGHRLAAEEPRVPIWATIDLSPGRHRPSNFGQAYRKMRSQWAPAPERNISGPCTEGFGDSIGDAPASVPHGLKSPAICDGALEVWSGLEGGGPLIESAPTGSRRHA